ncbi:YigZ family protein [Rodentibacter caecimuris]|uniref:YigZ family protein n=1 Tax=Rodentibacter caecimuris TaxID=1796644 RepID=A0ABX3L3Q2_9PAST|nr:YigZ family protein [Rodentibacter heylii]
MNEYFVPKSEVLFEEEIKRSRFITYIRHTEGIEQAREFWQEIKLQHPTARHHCWAAVGGSPVDSQQFGFSDDGEPAGTAGKPMLNALLGSRIGEISVVIVRYFGGILLGTGGLVRAYGNGVQQALKLVETKIKIQRRIFYLICEYAQLNLVQMLCGKYDVEIYQQDFQQNISLSLGISDKSLQLFEQELNERSSGQLKLVSGS